MEDRSSHIIKRSMRLKVMTNQNQDLTSTCLLLNKDQNTQIRVPNTIIKETIKGHHNIQNMASKSSSNNNIHKKEVTRSSTLSMDRQSIHHIKHLLSNIIMYI